MHEPALWVALLSLVAALFIAALYPLRFDPPRICTNDVVKLDDGSWSSGTYNIDRTPGVPEFLGASVRSGELRIELSLNSDSQAQFGPARILSISKDQRNANLAIAQFRTDLLVRLQRPGSTPWGAPVLVLRGFFEELRWHDVVVHLTPGQLQLFVDGVQSLNEPLPPNLTDQWLAIPRRSLGSEPTGMRHWRGRLRRAGHCRRAAVRLLAFNATADSAQRIPVARATARSASPLSRPSPQPFAPS